MSHVIQPGASMHGIALNHDFQQSPTGSLGGRSVQQGQAQPPRGLARVLSHIGHGIQNLGSRLLNAVTPHSVRADTKFRTGLKDTSAQLGQLLGALSQNNQQAADPAAAQRLLQGLRTTAEPVTSRGVAYEQLIVQRTAVHLSQMTPPQREALHTGLAQAQQNGTLQNDPTLALLRSAMEQNAVQAGVAQLEQGLDTAIALTAKEAQDKGITGRAFSELYNTARNVLVQQGFGKLPAGELKDMSRALVLQALEQRLGDMDDEAVFVPIATMINQLPSKELHALAHQQVQIGTRPIESTNFMVQGAIGLRSQQLEQTLTDSFAALLGRTQPAEDDANGILHNPQSVAREVAIAGQALADLREHSDLHHLHFPAQLDTAYAHTLDHLERYLNDDNLIQLSELNSSQLHAMGQGLRQLGVESGQTAITADAARRRTESLDDYAQALQPGLQALAQGDLGAAFKTLANAQPRGDDALEIHMNLGMKVEGADEIMNFRDQLMARALRDLDPLVLTALSQRLNSTVVQEDLIDALAGAAMPLLSGGASMEAYDPNVGRTMFDRTTDLSIMRTAVDQRLGELGIAVPAPLWTGNLDPAQLILTEYGVTMTSDGNVAVRTGRAGPAVQEAVQTNLESILETLDKSPPSLAQPLVSDAFVKDLPRANYAIVDDNGIRTELSELNGGTREAMIDNAVQQLRTLTGGNDQLLMLATQLANQNVHAGLQKVLMTQQSPLRLPDGTAGALMGQEGIVYAFSSDGEGGLNLHLEYSVTNPNAFLPAPRHANDGVGVPIMLNPEPSSAQFSFALHIGADLNVQVSEPLRYTYDAVQAD